MVPFGDLAVARRGLRLYGVSDPGVDVLTHAMEGAWRDVCRYVGWEPSPLFVTPEQGQALEAGVVAQTAFRLEQSDLQLGADDGLAGIGGLLVSLKPVPRFSPEAAEVLAGHGLIQRTLTAAPEA